MTLPVKLAQFVGIEGIVRLGPLAASALLATLPSLLMFVVIQRWLTRGLLSGAVKGYGRRPGRVRGLAGWAAPGGPRRLRGGLPVRFVTPGTGTDGPPSAPVTGTAIRGITHRDPDQCQSERGWIE